MIFINNHCSWRYYSNLSRFFIEHIPPNSKFNTHLTTHIYIWNKIISDCSEHHPSVYICSVLTSYLHNFYLHFCMDHQVAHHRSSNQYKYMCLLAVPCLLLIVICFSLLLHYHAGWHYSYYVLLMACLSFCSALPPGALCYAYVWGMFSNYVLHSNHKYCISLFPFSHPWIQVRFPSSHILVCSAL